MCTRHQYKAIKKCIYLFISQKPPVSFLKLTAAAQRGIRNGKRWAGEGMNKTEEPPEGRGIPPPSSDLAAEERAGQGLAPGCATGTRQHRHPQHRISTAQQHRTTVNISTDSKTTKIFGLAHPLLKFTWKISLSSSKENVLPKPCKSTH